MERSKIIIASIILILVIVIAYFGFSYFIGSKNVTLTNSSIDIASLAKYDGKGSNACRIAYQGKVYELDQTKVRFWVNGSHSQTQGVNCGMDITAKMKEAPHGEKVLKELKLIN